jgi:hypothetical protein
VLIVVCHEMSQDFQSPRMATLRISIADFLKTNKALSEGSVWERAEWHMNFNVSLSHF